MYAPQAPAHESFRVEYGSIRFGADLAGSRVGEHEDTPTVDQLRLQFYQSHSSTVCFHRTSNFDVAPVQRFPLYTPAHGPHSLVRSLTHFDVPTLHNAETQLPNHTKSHGTLFALTLLTQLVPKYGDRPRVDSANRGGCGPQPWPPHYAISATLSARILEGRQAGGEIDEVCENQITKNCGSYRVMWENI